MIDIIFFLLVFFMMNMLSMVHLKTISVNLPEASTAAVHMVMDVPVSIKANGQIYVEKTPIALNNLERSLKGLKQNNKKIEIILNADEKVSYGVVVKVLDIIKKVGIQDVVVATK